MITTIHYQYDLIKSSRLALFDFCRSLSSDHFLLEHTNFGRGSIRNLLVHVVNVYELWVGDKALRRKLEFTSFDAVNNIDQTVVLYEKVDSLVETFIASIAEAPLTEVSFEKDGEQNTATALTLFTHVITHEFHHKGQILSMSRHMGYVPIDTDIIR